MLLCSINESEITDRFFLRGSAAISSWYIKNRVDPALSIVLNHSSVDWIELTSQYFLNLRAYFDTKWCKQIVLLCPVFIFSKSVKCVIFISRIRKQSRWATIRRRRRSSSSCIMRSLKWWTNVSIPGEHLLGIRLCGKRLHFSESLWQHHKNGAPAVLLEVTDSKHFVQPAFISNPTRGSRRRSSCEPKALRDTCRG